MTNKPASTRTMRDALLERHYECMQNDDRLFFVSADFGAPCLDKIRADFGDRFINVGIAEQNLINVATGLALEGFVVYAYAIASFITMRAFEQIRVNLALSSQFRKMNVNLIGVGAGVSYDMAGPTHHCLEDLSIMRSLPNIGLYSPCDWIGAQSFIDYSIKTTTPKYVRLDGKALIQRYEDPKSINWDKGFCQLLPGQDVCIVATGNMTQRAMEFAKKVDRNIGVLDLFKLKPLDEEALFEALKGYKQLMTIEEGFINTGGLDSLVSNLLMRKKANIEFKNFGFSDKYIFMSGSRESIYDIAGFGENKIIDVLKKWTA